MQHLTGGRRVSGVLGPSDEFLKISNQFAQGGSLGGQLLGGAGALFCRRSVRLGHFIHLGNGHIDLVDSLALLT